MPDQLDPVREELHRELLVDHGQRPRHEGRPAGDVHAADASNPLCGDRFRVFVGVAGDRVARIGFEGRGCVLSTASTSLMTEALDGRPVTDAVAAIERVQGLLSPSADPVDDVTLDELGPLAALTGARRHLNRIRCATLGWLAARQALEAATAAERGEST